jgi:hypothetical protein
MGGGLMQLVAYGAQDIYLTGNPQITFFKVVYRRHTNFAVESIEQTFNGTPNFGNRVTATISRNGDLIQQMYLEVVLPYNTTSTAKWVYGIGNAMINKAEIEIGGQLIDRHYGEWLDIWTELSVPAGKRSGYDDMVGNSLPGKAVGTASSRAQDVRLYVPLQFWFNRNPGLALPLIALQYHEVKLNLELNSLGSLTTETVSAFDNSLTCKLYVDYVYLDTDERRRFAQVSHEYLIEQVQFTGDETVASGDSSKNFTLNFNHPCKELVWVHRLASLPLADNTSGNDMNYFNFSTITEASNFGTGVDTFYTGKLQLNGHDRFTTRYADYFRKVQNLEHHTRVPRTLVEGGTINAPQTPHYRHQFIYSYSFAISPEEHQPSGTCNFSRIDNAVLQLTYDTTGNTSQTANALNLKVFAVNYNVLRIMSGMGGLAYSN